MRFTEAFLSVIKRLGNIPGLKFLHNYKSEADNMKARFGQQRGDYINYISSAKGATRDIKGAYANEDDDLEDGEGEEGDDLAPAQDRGDGLIYEDYYDHYEDEEGTADSHEPVDDYPASDENNSYFDDDYRR